MPDPATIGTGAGAGGAIIGAAWLLERLLGRRGPELSPVLDALAAIAEKLGKLYEWHDVADPDDATQRIWWLSKYIRRTIVGTNELLGQQTELIENLNKNLAALVEVTTQLRRDVAALKRGRDE